MPVPFSDLTLTMSKYVVDTEVDEDPDQSEGLTLIDGMSAVTYSTE